VREPLQWRQV